MFARSRNSCDSGTLFAFKYLKQTKYWMPTRLSFFSYVADQTPRNIFLRKFIGYISFLLITGLKLCRMPKSKFLGYLKKVSCWRKLCKEYKIKTLFRYRFFFFGKILIYVKYLMKQNLKLWLIHTGMAVAYTVKWACTSSYQKQTWMAI